MEILIAILAIISIPIYVLCVAILIAVSPIFGSYVDASVYVCEYGQPVITGILTLCFAIFGFKYAVRAFNRKMFYRFAILLVILLIYLVVIYMSVNSLSYRIETYDGMTNRQIFDFVVEKLRQMGSSYDGTVEIMGHQVGIGYIMANFITYILPITVTLLCGIVQRITIKKLKN